VLRKTDGSYPDYRYEPTECPPVLIELEKILFAEPDLAIFNGQLQVMGNGAIRWEIPQLVIWLLKRGYRVGAEIAVHDLERYVRSQYLQSKRVLGLAGLKVKAVCRMERGIELLSWADLQDSVTKKLIYENCIQSIHPFSPSAALTQELQFAKRHIREGEKFSITPPGDIDLDDAVLIISAVGPFAPRIVASWIELPDWAPSLGVGYSIPYPEGIVRNDEWESTHCPIAAEIHKKFLSLDTATKQNLRVPMGRLRSGLQSASEVDAAIDLGIALEGLYLDEDGAQGELNFRLRLRMSRYLEADPVLRRSTFNLGKNIYDMRSSAVHKGRVERRYGRMNTPDILREGFKDVADTIISFIRRGKPDWDSIQLG